MCLSLPHFVITRKDTESDPDVDADSDANANATEVIVALCNYNLNHHLSVSTTIQSQIVERGNIFFNNVDLLSLTPSPCETGFSHQTLMTCIHSYKQTNIVCLITF